MRNFKKIFTLCRDRALNTCKQQHCVGNLQWCEIVEYLKFRSATNCAVRRMSPYWNLSSAWVQRNRNGSSIILLQSAHFLADSSCCCWFLLSGSHDREIQPNKIGLNERWQKVAYQARMKCSKHLNLQTPNHTRRNTISSVTFTVHPAHANEIRNQHNSVC